MPSTLFDPKEPLSRKPDYFVWTDGGARGNPGPAAAAYVICNAAGRHLSTGGAYLGKATNNTAEYQGVLLALKYLIGSLPLPSPALIDITVDSVLICEQLSGRYKIKQAHLKELARAINQLTDIHKLHLTYHHVPRAQNSAADAEVNRILDKQLFSQP